MSGGGIAESCDSSMFDYLRKEPLNCLLQPFQSESQSCCLVGLVPGHVGAAAG